MTLYKRFVKLLPQGFKDKMKSKGRKIRWFIHDRGKGVFCPCCGKYSRKMVGITMDISDEIYDSGKFRLENRMVECPYCKSFPRQRMAAFAMDRIHPEILNPDSRFLVFAPEESTECFFKRKKMKYTTADLHGPADLTLDIENIDLTDQSYDVVICNHVLEHVNDYRKAIEEVYRILKLGGCFLCTVPGEADKAATYEDASICSEEGRIKAFGQADHLRIFGMDIKDTLMKSGFLVEVIKGDDLPEEIVPITGPSDLDLNWVFWCKKE